MSYDLMTKTQIFEVVKKNIRFEKWVFVQQLEILIDKNADSDGWSFFFVVSIGLKDPLLMAGGWCLTFPLKSENGV